MDSFHLKKAAIVINKEKDLKHMTNFDKMRNVKIEQEAEFVGTIDVSRHTLKQEKCIKMEPISQNEIHLGMEIQNGNDDKIKLLKSNECSSKNHQVSNGFNSRSLQESKNGSNHLNNLDEGQSTSNLESPKKRKLLLRIDSVESLSPKKVPSVSSVDSSPRQVFHGPKRGNNELESRINESFQESSPKQIHHGLKRSKNEDKNIRNSPNSNHKLLKNGNDSHPYKKLEQTPYRRFEVHRQDPLCHKAPKLHNPNSPVSRFGGKSLSSRKVNPLPPNPSALPLYQKQVLTNLKIFKGLDLMCWVTDPKKIRTNEKYEVAYRNMTKKHPLISLFKCMGKKCSYTADDPLKMLNHLTIHENEMKKQCQDINKKYMTEMKTVFDEHERAKIKLKESEEMIAIYDHFLCCAYCQLREKDAKSLVHHVNDIHRKDIYQCGFCFFRSCVKETCLEHWEVSHKNRVILIYECLGKEKLQLAKNKVMLRLLEKRKTNVVPLICKVCNVGYYPLKEFLDHCEKDHREEHERIQVEKCLHILDQAFKAHGYGMYQCLYCLHGCHKESKMSSHLIQHPSEFGFYCMRQPNRQTNYNPNFYHTIESTRVIEVQKEVSIMEFNEKPESLNCRNYKEVVDSDLQKMLN